MDKMLCPTCNKTRIPLAQVHPELQITLNLLGRHSGRTASELLGLHPGIGVTAINNRLEDLRSLGLVSRMRDGKAFRYYPKRKGERK